MNFLFFYVYSSQNLSERAQRAERAGPMPFTKRAGPGRKSRPVRTSIWKTVLLIFSHSRLNSFLIFQVNYYFTLEARISQSLNSRFPGSASNRVLLIALVELENLLMLIFLFIFSEIRNCIS